MTDFPPLTESEVQAETAKHGRLVLPRREDESLFPEDGCCAVCLLEPWPCPTIRLIAERERLERVAKAAWKYMDEYDPGFRIFKDDDEMPEDWVEESFALAVALVEWHRAALAETGEKDD